MSHHTDDSHGGRGESLYLTPVQENKIVASMLNSRLRWPVTEEAKQEAAEVTRKNLKALDGRVANGAVLNLLRMERQNQADEHQAAGKHVHHTHTVTLTAEERAAHIAAIMGEVIDVEARVLEDGNDGGSARGQDQGPLGEHDGRGDSPPLPVGDGPTIADGFGGKDLGTDVAKPTPPADSQRKASPSRNGTH